MPPGSHGAEVLAPADGKAPFIRHALALAAVWIDLVRGDLLDVMRVIPGPDTSSFADFLVKQGLGSFWYHHIAGCFSRKNNRGCRRPERVHLAEIALYLGQRSLASPRAS